MGERSLARERCPFVVVKGCVRLSLDMCVVLFGKDTYVWRLKP